MSIIALRHLLPDVADRDASFMNFEDDPRIPRGMVFRLEEFYCVDPTCNCRRVLVQVLDSRTRKPHVTISHSFRPIEHDAWNRRYTDEQTFIDPLNPRSELAEPLLKAVKHLLTDQREYASMIQRHYREVKQAIQTPGHPILAQIPKEFRPAAPRVERSQAGRNDPCGCGSGKKFKKCCGRAKVNAAGSGR